MSSPSALPGTRQHHAKSREIDSTVLFGDTKVLTILHHDEQYRLRITATKKLILTK